MADYEYDVVYRSSLTGRFYFARKVRVLSTTTRCVVGRKYDITTQIEPFLLKRFRRVERPKRRSGR